MFASNVHGFDSLRGLVEGGHDYGNVISVDFSLSDSFGASAGVPSTAQPLRGVSFGM
ncbi:MAG: hypothetical protein WBK55_03155 [Alphaproteobacteria bacterium]